MIRQQDMDVSIAIFKAQCACKNIGISTKAVPQSSIPQSIPTLMKEFYARFAPISVKLLNVQFVPYDILLDCIRQDSDLKYIPIAFYNNDYRNQMAYIDRNADGSWDYRVQLPIGNGKVQILGQDVFDYLIQLSKRLQDE